MREVLSMENRVIDDRHGTDGRNLASKYRWILNKTLMDGYPRPRLYGVKTVKMYTHTKEREWDMLPTSEFTVFYNLFKSEAHMDRYIRQLEKRGFQKMGYGSYVYYSDRFSGMAWEREYDGETYARNLNVQCFPPKSRLSDSHISFHTRATAKSEPQPEAQRFAKQGDYGDYDDLTRRIAEIEEEARRRKARA